MSGLIAVSEEGVVESCNHHFAKMMFGYAQDELVGQVRYTFTSVLYPMYCTYLIA
jgi:sensor histidine kinase regulating citrate/malate metabolism